MNLLIVEDEALSARRLRSMLTEIDPTFRVLDILDSVSETVTWLHQHPTPDLIFMDIELTDGRSFEIFEKTVVACPVIFVTAYDEYAIQAFKVNSIDYLLKPVKREELIRSIDKFRQLHRPVGQEVSNVNLAALLHELQSKPGYKDRFLLKQGDRLIPVETADIAYFQTKDKNNFIHTFDNKEYQIEQSLDEVEKTLNPKLFFRANRQFIVSAMAVEKIHFWFSSKLKVDIKPYPGEDVIISRDKAMAFRNWMGE